MLGTVVGPLLATLLIWAGVDFRIVILCTLIPGLFAAGWMFFLTREHEPQRRDDTLAKSSDARFPRLVWLFLIGVLFFGLGDFSRTFLILLAGQDLGEGQGVCAGSISGAVLLYSLHNLVGAMAAFPVGHLGDRTSKVRVLAFGYAIGVVTNLLLAFFSHSLPWLVLAILLSGFYIAVEETLEKAVVVGMLPKELRSRGLGVLACVNAVGDMVSSIYVGSLVQVGRPGLAFGLAAFVGALGTPWLFTSSRTRNEKTLNQHPAPSRLP